MKTKSILRTLTFAMLMPAILLTTACSNINDNEDTNKKGYTLPVTVNVTRQDDDTATKATYNETDKKLEFSSGDQLFVRGWNTSSGGSGLFAGTLTWTSGGTFSGTITVENKSYSGDADALFTEAQYVEAILLPAGYGPKQYLSILYGEGYDAALIFSPEVAIADSKATAVEQFSREYAYGYNNGFALSPQNAILHFTITGLSASTAVNVKLIDNNSATISGSVTTNASGSATFAIGISGNTDLNSLALTVGGYAITLTTSSKTLEAGHIYNITRSLSPISFATTSDLGKVIGANGNIYVDAAAATTAGTTAVAMIAYVGSATGEAAPYNHGLALALSDASNGNKCMWKSPSSLVHAYQATSASFACESGLQYNSYTPDHNTDIYPAFKAAMANNGTAAPTGCSAWFLPTGYQWNQMINACKNVLGTKNSCEDLRDGFSGIGGTNLQWGNYFSSTEWDEYNAWYYYFYNGKWGGIYKYNSCYVRSALAF